MRNLLFAGVLLLTALSQAFSQSVYFQSRAGRITIPVGSANIGTGGSNSNYSPADAAVDYFGTRQQSIPGNTGFRRVQIPPGTWYVIEYSGSAAKAGGETSTGELSTWAVYKNATSSLGDTGTFDHPTVNTAQTHWRFTGLNLGPLVGGDYIELRATHPTWATNPTAVMYFGLLTLERRD